MEVLLYLLIGLLLGGAFGYIILKLIIQKNYIDKTEADQLRKTITELQLQNVTKLSREEVSENFVSKELHQNIALNLKTAEQHLQQEKENCQNHRVTILRLTGELEQKLSKTEVNEQYIPKSSFEIVNRKLDTVERDVEKKDAIILGLSNQVTELEKKEEFLVEKLQHQKKELEDFRKTSLLEFENIATRILKTKTSEFTESNRTNIEAILKPLGEDINKFKTKVEEVYEKEAKQRFSLEEKVKELVEQTNKVSDEANNLATALKGQSKKQGNWGEVILESILEKSGLVKNREYFVQKTIRNEEGMNLRPDVLVELPDNRTIIIDSKVSLVAYDKFCNCDTKEQQDAWLTDHVKSIYHHVNDLSSKNYDNLETSLDFTMMFIPIEPAYLIAIQHDPELWSHAYSKRILLISPTNLFASLKLIADIWKREYQSKNALEIVKKGEELYEKFVGFTNSMSDIGVNLHRTQSAYDNALSQLKNGKGNLVSKAIQLKNLGLKSNKQVNAGLIPTDYDADENEMIENKSANQ